MTALLLDSVFQDLQLEKVRIARLLCHSFVYRLGFCLPGYAIGEGKRLLCHSFVYRLGFCLPVFAIGEGKNCKTFLSQFVTVLLSS